MMERKITPDSALDQRVKESTRIVAYSKARARSVNAQAVNASEETLSLVKEASTASFTAGGADSDRFWAMVAVDFGIPEEEVLKMWDKKDRVVRAINDLRRDGITHIENPDNSSQN